MQFCSPKLFTVFFCMHQRVHGVPPAKVSLECLDYMQLCANVLDVFLSKIAGNEILGFDIDTISL